MIEDEKLPEVHDLRHYGTHDFTGPVKNQLHCGACHVASFLHSIESRLRI